MDDLDAYAAAGRKKKAEADERARKRKAGRHGPSEGELRARVALGGTRYSILALSVVVSGISFSGYFVLRGLFATPVPEIGVAVTTVVLMGCGFVVSGRFRDRAFERERKRLRALPFAVDWDAYERALQDKRMKTKVTLRGHFTRAVDETEARRIGDAVYGMIKHSGASCDPQMLTIHSEDIDTWFIGSADSDSYYSNAPTHRWVKHALEALLLVHRNDPIARLDIHLSG